MSLYENHLKTVSISLQNPTAHAGKKKTNFQKGRPMVINGPGQKSIFKSQDVEENKSLALLAV